jgi:hypothetical protein
MSAGANKYTENVDRFEHFGMHEGDAKKLNSATRPNPIYCQKQKTQDVLNYVCVCVCVCVGVCVWVGCVGGVCGCVWVCVCECVCGCVCALGELSHLWKNIG